MLLWTELVSLTISSWTKNGKFFQSNFAEAMCFFCIGLGIFGFVFLPSGFSSFDIASNNATLVNSTDFSDIRKSIGHYSYLPLALILIMQFFITIGITTIPQLLTSEVFPFKWGDFIFLFSLSWNLFVFSSFQSIDIVQCFVALYQLNDICLLRLHRDFISVWNSNFHCLALLFSTAASVWLGIIHWEKIWYFCCNCIRILFLINFLLGLWLCHTFYQKQKTDH